MSATVRTLPSRVESAASRAQRLDREAREAGDQVVNDYRAALDEAVRLGEVLLQLTSVSPGVLEHAQRIGAAMRSGGLGIDAIMARRP